MFKKLNTFVRFGLFPDSESVSLHQTMSGSGQNTQPAVVLISRSGDGDTLILKDSLYGIYLGVQIT